MTAADRSRPKRAGDPEAEVGFEHVQRDALDPIAQRELMAPRGFLDGREKP
jgi:hypothetical protein